VICAFEFNCNRLTPMADAPTVLPIAEIPGRSEGKNQGQR
jgi:hypothetical protein